MSYLNKFKLENLNILNNLDKTKNNNINSESYLNKLKLNYLKPFNNINIYKISFDKIPFDKKDFPIFSNNKNLIWFDNGATTQKPYTTINMIKKYYEYYNSNIHRSPHYLSIISSNLFDETRILISQYLNCHHSEIIFVKGTTEGINLIANTLNYKKILNENIPSVLLTNMEHHSNIVPWQLLKQKNIINIDYIDYDKKLNKINLLDLENKLLSNKLIKIISITHVSNVLGITNPIDEISKIAKKYNCILIVDGAQGIPHFHVDIKKLNCDFYVFSSHKVFGPTGVGIIYCNKKLYNLMEPWQGGGSMIKNVSLYETEFQEPPHKFEAGTPNIADIIAFSDTIKYLNKINWNEIEEYEKKLTHHFYISLKKIPNIIILGDTLENKVPIFSFIIPNIDDNKLLSILDENKISIRYGHHCAQPIIKYFGFDNVYRASLAPYNTCNEIDRFVNIILNFIT